MPNSRQRAEQPTDGQQQQVQRVAAVPVVGEGHGEEDNRRMCRETHQYHLNSIRCAYRHILRRLVGTHHHKIFSWICRAEKKAIPSCMSRRNDVLQPLHLFDGIRKRHLRRQVRHLRAVIGKNSAGGHGLFFKFAIYAEYILWFFGGKRCAKRSREVEVI